MDHNEREARRRQEDRDLNRALIWVGAAIVLEFLLVLVNRYYINFRTTTESINLALAINAGLNVLRWASLAALIVCAVWAFLRLNKGEKATLPLILMAASGALLLCSQVILGFRDAGVRMLFWLVPAWAALALVYYLYQREFFLAALVSGLGVLGLWFVRHTGAASWYTIVAVAAILVVAVVLFWMKGHQGRLVVKEGTKRVLPSDASYFFGPISSIFDILTFCLMWWVFHANTPETQTLFQSGWFVVGLLSQTLIVHMIRTRRVPFIQSCASWPLMIMTVIVMIVGIALPFSPLASYLQLQALPLSYFPWLVAILAGYMTLTQLVKGFYSRRYGWQ